MNALGCKTQTELCNKVSGELKAGLACVYVCLFQGGSLHVTPMFVVWGLDFFFLMMFCTLYS